MGLQPYALVPNEYYLKGGKGILIPQAYFKYNVCVSFFQHVAHKLGPFEKKGSQLKIVSIRPACGQVRGTFS